MREWIIYTASGERHAIEAPSLRAAVRKFGAKNIVAAVEAVCLPAANEDPPQPFLAVFLSNPRFTAPPEFTPG